MSRVHLNCSECGKKTRRRYALTKCYLCYQKDKHIITSNLKSRGFKVVMYLNIIEEKLLIDKVIEEGVPMTNVIRGIIFKKSRGQTKLNKFNKDYN